VTLHVFDIQDGAVVKKIIYALDGSPAFTFAAQRQGETITLRAEGTSKPWQAVLRGIPSVKSVDGGKAQSQAVGVLVKPEKGKNQLTITVIR
jgi:alpha-D-xyloside xylohydrolase